MASVIIVPNSKGRVTAVQLANAAWEASLMGPGGCMDILPNYSNSDKVVVRANDDVSEVLDNVLANIVEQGNFHPFTIWASALSKNPDEIYGYNNAMIEYIRAYVVESSKHQAAFDALEEPSQEVWCQGKRMVTLIEHHSPRIINTVADPELAVVLTCYDNPEPCVVAVATDGRHRHLFTTRRQTFATAQEAYTALQSQIRERDTWENWLRSLIFGHRPCDRPCDRPCGYDVDP